MQQKEKLSYTVEVKDLPALLVSYVRHVGRFQDISGAFNRLMR
jgi:DNA gyrase inhibitor GyrI